MAAPNSGPRAPSTIPRGLRVVNFPLLGHIHDGTSFLWDVQILAFLIFAGVLIVLIRGFIVFGREPEQP